MGCIVFLECIWKSYVVDKLLCIMCLPTMVINRVLKNFSISPNILKNTKEEISMKISMGVPAEKMLQTLFVIQSLCYLSKHGTRIHGHSSST